MCAVADAATRLESLGKTVFWLLRSYKTPKPLRHNERRVTAPRLAVVTTALRSDTTPRQHPEHVKNCTLFFAGSTISPERSGERVVYCALQFDGTDLPPVAFPATFAVPARAPTVIDDFGPWKSVGDPVATPPSQGDYEPRSSTDSALLRLINVC